MKKFFISLFVISILLEGCSILKRRYCKGYYVDVELKHSDKTPNKKIVNFHITDSAKLNNNTINSLSPSVDINSTDNLYAYQSAFAEKSVAFFKQKNKERNFEEKKCRFNLQVLHFVKTKHH